MYLGIDIGGTKTLLVAFDDTGSIRQQHKFPTDQDYDKFIDDLSTHLAELETKVFHAAAVGVPGKVNREDGIVYALGNLPWRDKPIRQDIAKLISSSVIIENDSKAAALAEARAVLHTHKRVLYLTIGTGVGTGLVINGELEPNLLDSEVGKMIFPYKSKLQSWESFASGRAIFETYHKKASEIDDPTIWEAITQDIGIGVIAACAAFQPEAIIFGGGVGAHFEKFADPLKKFIDAHLHPVIQKPELLHNTYDELSVAYGCYELIKHFHGQLDS